VSDCEHDVCITCGDVAVEMRVVRLDGDLAVCEAQDGDVRTVEVALLEGVEAGDTLLVHADVALVRAS
jgi:hydrogenase maturation factor